MEVLKISDSKLKVMLTREDMHKYSLRAESIDYNNASTRKSFFEILDTIKSTHGFDTEGDKVLIQFYPSKDGGCELFITKLGLLPPSSERSIARSDRVTMLATRRMLYKFLRLSDLIRAVKLLKNGDAKYSDVFYDELGSGRGGDYYLEVMERGVSRGGAISVFDLLLEYADKVDKIFYPYITEHCKRLTQGNAIELLSAL